MSEGKTSKEIINNSNIEFDMLADHDMDKFYKQFNRIFGLTNEYDLSEPSSIKRSCSIEMKDENNVKIEINEKRTYDFEDDFEDEMDEEGIMVYSSDPSIETPKQEVVPLEVARQWNREREKIKQERIKNNSKNIEDVSTN